MLFAGASAQHACQLSKQSQQAMEAKGGGGSVEPWPIDILHQRIALDLTLGQVIAGACTITAVPRSENTVQFPLHLLALTVDSVTWNGVHLTFDHQDELLLIDLGQPFGTADTLELTVFYGGDPVVDPSGFGGFYTGSTYVYNLGVAFQSIPHSYGRTWFPCVDNFMERNTYEFVITTPVGRTSWCNGTLLSETTPGGGVLVRNWRKDLPIPAYLASVAAADYAVVRDTFPSISGSEIPVVLVARPQDTTNMKNSFINLRTAFDHFESWFGRFRWDKVGYVATPQGAMEHSTSIHYPTSIINGNLQYQSIMAHELGHEWFGNLVTCERPEEMYINEGGAEFLSFLFLEALYGREHYLNIVRNNHRQMVHKAHLLDEGWWALADVPQQWTYGEHSYRKGADVLHTLRGYLGDPLFITGFTSFLETYQFQPVNSMMMRDHLSTVTGVDLGHFFSDWIFQPGWSAFEVDSFTVVPSTNATTIHVEQKLRGASSLYTDVPLTVTCIAADGTRWNAPERMMAGGTQSTTTVQPPFAPAQVLLNADDLIALAITADEDTLVQNGTIQYPRSNMRLTVSALPGPVPIRIEQYWVAADPEAADAFAYAISPDRWWRIVGNIPGEAIINGRIDYDARPTTGGSIDVGLMQDQGGVVFREDSLVLLYRPDQHSPWMLHPSFTVNMLNNATDKWGRIDFTGVQAGEYTLGWRKSHVGVNEIPALLPRFILAPNPAHDHTTIWSDHPVAPGAQVHLLDTQGRSVGQEKWQGSPHRIELGGLPAGSYTVRVMEHGRPHALGTVILHR
jgi:hypothetical protein